MSGCQGGGHSGREGRIRASGHHYNSGPQGGRGPGKFYTRAAAEVLISGFLVNANSQSVLVNANSQLAIVI